jgi:hypothetical protein
VNFLESKMKKFANIRKQRGIAVITMVLLVVTLLAVIGAVVATSRTTASSTSDQTARLMAAGIIDEGNMLKIGFDIMQAKGTSIDAITFGMKAPAAGIQGLFNLTTGTAVIQVPPPDAATGTWMMARGGTAAAAAGMATLTGVTWPTDVALATMSPNPYYAVLLTGVKDSVCRQINSALRGYSTTGTIPSVTQAVPAAISVVAGNADENNSAAFSMAGFSFTGVVDTANVAVTALNGYSVCVKPAAGVGVDNNIYLNVVRPI